MIVSFGGVLSVIMIIVAESTHLKGSCNYLSSGNIPGISSVCNQIVNYSFFINEKNSIESMNKEAILLLNTSFVSILPNQCQLWLKKLVCESIFLKCWPLVNLKNPLSWPIIHSVDSNISYPAPFQRPCKMGCENTISQCRGMLSLLNDEAKYQFGCDKKIDYSDGLFPLSSPYQYDPSNDVSICSYSSSQALSISVGDNKETYLHSDKGVCQGIKFLFWLLCSLLLLFKL